jgi:fatty-acyl-CoA synthase
VIMRGDEALDVNAVREFCTGRIAHYKIPRYVKVVDTFPMTVTGKVQKFKMREQAIDELGLSDSATIRTA